MTTACVTKYPVNDNMEPHGLTFTNSIYVINGIKVKFNKHNLFAILGLYLFFQTRGRHLFYWATLRLQIALMSTNFLYIRQYQSCSDRNSAFRLEFTFSCFPQKQLLCGHILIFWMDFYLDILQKGFGVEWC